MKNIKTFELYSKDLILEKSIGTEEIYNKWYSDIDKKTFYKIVNIDPTSIRKKDFSKPGKYTKWLIQCYKKLSKEEERFDFEYSFDSNLNFALFIFSTGWYKSKVKKESFYLGGELNKTIENDIFKFKTLSDFESHMYKLKDEYRVQTEEGKFDIVYSDDKVDILIPINFTASYELSKNTDWCSKSYSGFSMFNKKSILYRIIPKDKSLDKVKISWAKNNEIWYIACSKYPEINGKESPFDIVNGLERWKERKNYWDSINDSRQWQQNSIKIEETMNLLNDKAKNTIKEHYDKYGKDK